MQNIDFDYFCNNWKSIEYNGSNITIYYDYVENNDLHNKLVDDNGWSFNEFIIMEYVIKKCEILEYIYNYPCVKDFIKRSIGDFEYFSANDYVCARFYNTNESLQYIAKYYGYNLSPMQLVTPNLYNSLYFAIAKYKEL